MSSKGYTLSNPATGTQSDLPVVTGTLGPAAAAPAGAE